MHLKRTKPDSPDCFGMVSDTGILHSAGCVFIQRKRPFHAGFRNDQGLFVSGCSLYFFCVCHMPLDLHRSQDLAPMRCFSSPTSLQLHHSTSYNLEESPTSREEKHCDDYPYYYTLQHYLRRWKLHLLLFSFQNLRRASNLKESNLPLLYYQFDRQPHRVRVLQKGHKKGTAETGYAQNR